MKQVNLYIRVHQVRNLDNVRIKYIGCLLLEYKEKHKYTFIDNVGECDQKASMLRMLLTGLEMLKEPCHVVIYMLNDITRRKRKYSDSWGAINECIMERKHEVSFRVYQERQGEKRDVFNKFKRELDCYKSMGEQRGGTIYVSFVYKIYLSINNWRCITRLSS